MTTAGQGRLRQAAERAARRPFYLAAPLLAYAQAEGLDDAALARQLGCESARLAELLLCRRPTGAGRQFRDDVEAIAARFGLEAVRLATVLRAADSLVTFQGAAAARPAGLLAAARDRQDAATAGSSEGEVNDDATFESPEPERDR